MRGFPAEMWMVDRVNHSSGISSMLSYQAMLRGVGVLFPDASNIRHEIV